MPQVGYRGPVHVTPPAPPPPPAAQGGVGPPILPTAPSTVGARGPSDQNVGPGPAPSGRVYVPPASIMSGPTGAAPTHTDASSSGPGYGSAQANAFKQSQAYKAAVAAVFREQTVAQQAAIIKGLVGNPFAVHELAGVKAAFETMPSDQQFNLLSHLNGAGDTNLGDILGGAVDKGLGDAANVASQGISNILASSGPTVHGPNGQVQQLGIGNYVGVPIRAGIDIGRAALQSPSVIPKTAKGLGETALGSVAALAQLPINAVQEGPGKAVSQLASGMAQDYSQRYGPLVNGNDNAFIARIKKQGAGPELLDALGLVAGTDATLGRAAVDLAHTREAMTGAGDASSFLTRARPNLRVSGGEVRPQTMGRGALKITAQRTEDALRRIRGGRQVPAGPGEVTPLFEARAIRTLVSNTAQKTRRLMQNSLNVEVRHGAERAANALSPWERKAMPLAVEGIVPLRSGADAAVNALEARKQAILKERAANELSPGNRIPPKLAGQVDEVKLINDLQAHADKWVTPRLAQFVDHEAGRSARLEQNDLRVHPASAEARRLRPQGEMLGIKHPDEVAQAEMGALRRREAATAKVIERPGTVGELHAARAAIKRIQGKIVDLNSGETRPARLRAYSDSVRTAARDRGLPEPAYIKHQAHPKTDFSAYTQGMGHRAMPAAKQTTFSLFRGGVVDRSPQAYFDSLAKQIKGSHQWRLVDEQFRRNALPTVPAAAVRAALGRDKSAVDLTGFELSQVLHHMGVDLRNVRFYNPGRLAESTLADRGLLHGSRAGGAPPELEANASLAHELGQDAVTQDGAKLLNGGTRNEAFLTTKGWKAVPREAFDEIHSSLQPSGKAGRLVGKAQGMTAGAILGLSPSFLIMNTLAHVYLAAFGTRGRMLTDMVKFPIWWHGLPREARDIVDANAGGRGEFRLERLGSTARGDLTRSWQNLQRSGIMRAVQHVNPMRVLFRAEDMQSNFFRRMVYYSAAKRMAIDNIAHDLPLGARAAARVQHAFTTGPAHAIEQTLRSEASAEALGRHTVNMMGDYARFSSAERKWLNNRAVLFYSFLRHATRTLFYVLPFKHPIATALVGEMAKLHNDEVKKMLGGQDLPWAYSRVYFNKGGKLTSIDFLRASPVGSATAEIPAQGIKGAASLVAPELQPLLDMMYGQTALGQKVPANVFSALNSYLSLSYPYRLAKDLHFGTKQQQADSVPFLHERPQTFKSAKSRQYQAAKAAASGPESQKLLAGFLGLYPKPDDTRLVAQHIAAAAKKRTGGAGAPSSGGWTFGGGGTPPPAPSSSGGGGNSGGWSFGG